MTAATAESRRRAEIARRISELVEAALPLSDVRCAQLRAVFKPSVDSYPEVPDR